MFSSGRIICILDFERKSEEGWGERGYLTKWGAKLLA